MSTSSDPPLVPGTPQQTTTAERAPEAVQQGRRLAYVGLGSNQGDSTAILRQAADDLSRLPLTALVGRSRLFRTAPVGYADQPDFLNQVVALETGLGPFELLAGLQALETKAGRQRTVRWGPRTLDLDILWYDGMVVLEERLTLPHPRLEERRFVLEPLAELAPDLVLPSGRRVREALDAVQNQVVERVEHSQAGGETE